MRDPGSSIDSNVQILCSVKELLNPDRIKVCTFECTITVGEILSKFATITVIRKFHPLR